MSPETPGSRDNLPPKPPNNGENGDDRPNGGYPPSGQREALAKIRAKEAAETGNPESILAELDGAKETPEKRKQRLGEFVTANLADICPPEFRDKATGECLARENDLRDVMEDPTLKLEPEDAEDPDLQKSIKALVAVAKNDTEIASLQPKIENNDEAIADNTGKIETGKEDIAREEAKTPKLKADVTKAEKRVAKKQSQADQELVKEADKAHDLVEGQKLQDNFNQLRAQKGTIGALKTLLEPGKLKSPEARAIVQNVLNTATALVTALPGKSEVVSRILDRSNINLGAGSPIQIFAGFLAEADKSDELTEDEKAQIRKVLHKQIDIRSGSDMKKALDQGRGVKTTTDKDGNIHTEHIPYDRENMAEIQPGQYLYTDKQGKSIMRVEIDSGKSYEFILPEGSEADMGKVGIIGQVMDNMADYNMANPIYQRGITLQAGGRVELDFPRDWVTTQNVLKIFFDKTTGWDGGLLTEQDTEMMKHLMQGNAAKGDATRADADDMTSTKDFTTQGILDENGEVNWARFKEVVDHNRDQLGHGQIEFESGVEGDKE